MHTKTSSKKTIPIGDVEVLFELVSAFEMADPVQMASLFKSVLIHSEGRTVCEQMIDQFIVGDEERYKTYLEISNKRNDNKKHKVLGVFVDQWVKLETQLKELSGQKRLNMFTMKALEEIGVLPHETILEILEFRKMRNQMIHGTKVPDTEYIEKANKKLLELLGQVKTNRQL